MLDVDREDVVRGSVVDGDVTRFRTRRGSESRHALTWANPMFLFLFLFLLPFAVLLVRQVTGVNHRQIFMFPFKTYF